MTGTSIKFITDVEWGKETVQMAKVFDLILLFGFQIYLTTKTIPTIDQSYGTGFYQRIRGNECDLSGFF